MQDLVEYARIYAPSPYKPPLPPHFTPSPQPAEEEAVVPNGDGVRNGLNRAKQYITPKNTPARYSRPSDTPAASETLSADGAQNEDDGELNGADRRNNKLGTKGTPKRRANLSPDQLEALLTKGTFNTIIKA